MRYLRTVTVVLFISAIAVGSTHGQKGAPGINVNVPFQFVIGQTSFSPGPYLIISSRDKIWIQARGQNVAVLFTTALDGKVPDRNGRLIFACYSGECFLSQVWIAGQEAGRSLPKSKHQVQLASTGPRQEFALLGTKP